MKTVENIEKNYTTISLVVSHRFESLPDIVCSGSKIYQLPKMVGRRSYPLKEIPPRIHLGSVVYRIEKKRYFASKLKKLSTRVVEEFILEERCDCPF